MHVYGEVGPEDYIRPATELARDPAIGFPHGSIVGERQLDAVAHASGWRHECMKAIGWTKLLVANKRIARVSTSLARDLYWFAMTGAFNVNLDSVDESVVLVSSCIEPWQQTSQSELQAVHSTTTNPNKLTVELTQPIYPTLNQ